MVFVSYRRDDTGLAADDVARALSELVDGEVFFDLRSIGVGARFDARIEAALRRASVVVVLIGRGWAGDGGGMRRIDAADDVFRREIETALASDALVIPVLVGDMAHPATHELPASLQPLLARQWHRIRLENKHVAIVALAEQVRDAVEARRLDRLRAGGAQQPTTYRRIFDPSHPAGRFPGRPSPYARALWSDDAVFRVNVALATGRPLIVAGPDGAGREALPTVVAEALDRRLYRHDIHAASSPRDLMYRVDETRRLADAQAAALKPPGAYLEPGIVWWAFDPGSASRRGARDASPVDTMAFDPGLGSGRSAPDAVVHLAGDAASHLDVYFRVLEDRRFDVAEAGLRVQAQGELLVIATVADLRPVDRSLRDRAVICQLRLPRRDEMVAQARSVTGLDDGLIAAVVDRVIAAQDALGHIGGIQPRTVLDVLRAVQALGIDPATDGPDWPALLDALMPG